MGKLAVVFKSLFLGILLMPSILVCQDHLQIKKHWVGEKIDEFLSKEPGVLNHLILCREVPSDPNTLIRVDCPFILKAFDAKSDGWADSSVGVEPSMLPSIPIFTRWFFESGVLVRIRLDFNDNSTYRRISSDLTQKTGSSPVESTEAMQNGYGATWKNRHADWVTNEVHCALTENNSPSSSNGLRLLVERRAEYENRRDRLAHEASPLN